MSLWAVKVKRSIIETQWVEAGDRASAIHKAIAQSAREHDADVFRATEAKERQAGAS